MLPATPLAAALDAWAGSPDSTVEQVATASAVGALASACVRLSHLVADQPLSAPTHHDVATNASGDDQKPLDVLAEQELVAALTGGSVLALCSEESEEAINLNASGSVVVAIDPIDGSSNIDINGPTGTLFSILPVGPHREDPTQALLQPGTEQIAAGFVLYGPSTVMALTWGDGTDIYALDVTTGEFLLTHRRIELPSEAREYAINASNARHWNAGVRAYVEDLVNGSIGPRGQDFNMRWLAALVAEAYRILLRGGIFLYPGDARPGYADGRLRLVYEANPIAFLCEQAGGDATNGVERILDITPTSLHQRTPLVFGSRVKVERVRRYLIDPPTAHEESPLFGQRGLFRT